MGRRNNAGDLDRTRLHGNIDGRYGWLRNLDIHMVRGGKMREAVIISTILLLAVILWLPRQKGG